VVGESLNTDGDIMTSPGLEPLVKLIGAADKVYKSNFSFEKKFLMTQHTKKRPSDILAQYSEIADKLLPEFRDLLI
jgi:hypothetical protein